MTADCRLEVQLAKRLPGFELDVSWCVRNELAVLFGYSGSGKSLSLRMIAGLVKPDSGRVVLNDEVVFDSDSGEWVPPQKAQAGVRVPGPCAFPAHERASEHHLRSQRLEQTRAARARG